MTMDDPAAVVLRARNMLRDQDGKTSASELLVSLRATLAPLMQRKAALADDAARKLGEIEGMLDGADDTLDREQRDALDILLLGLWIRVELSGPNSRDS